MPSGESNHGEAIEVSAGLVFHEGRLLIARRFARDHLGGLWEFPGGKREIHETHEECLVRELREELEIQVEPFELVHRIRHEYPEKTVDLRFYRCRLLHGQPKAVGCDALAWVAPEELSEYEFPEADAQLIRLLTSRSYEGIWRS